MKENYNQRIDSIRENIIDEIELYWCERMTHLVDQNEIQNADSLYTEFVVDGKEPSEWVMCDSF